MDIKEPRPKKHNKLIVSQPLPIITNSDGTIHKFSGVFDGFSIKISIQDEMRNLNTMGCFGKANFSRGYPTFNASEDKTQFLRKRVFNRRAEWKAQFPIDTNCLKKVVVVPDSEDENEDYFINLMVEYQFDTNMVEEHLHLSLEEAFFLVSGIGCLDIYENGVILSRNCLWETFCNTDHYFVQNFITYYHFRAKNWVVKTGIKFGGDFLLYKDGPPFYHASYLVIIDVLDSATLKRRDDLCRRSMTTVNICGLNRLCETVGKELLICQLLWPSRQSIFLPDDISQFSANEVIFKRWISSQNRELDDN